MKGIVPLAKKIKRQHIDYHLNKRGIEIRTFSSELQRVMISDRARTKSIGMAAAALHQFLRGAGHEVHPRNLEDAIQTFYSLAPDCPVRQSRGGCGFNAGLELFVAARVLRPTVVVESGVYRGFTTWVLRAAAPQAKILSFDIDLSRIRRAEQAVEYIEADLSTYDFAPIPKERSLCFFDDHVSQALRLEQAHTWGFTDLIFDDNLPTHGLHRDAQAPFPTIDMIFDDALADGEVVEWKTRNRFRYEVDKADLTALREKIVFAERFPDLAWETGYGASNLTYVRLRRSPG